MAGKVIFLTVGRVHEDGTKISFNVGKCDSLVQELEAEGYRVEIETSSSTPARSVTITFKGQLIGNSSYELLKDRKEVNRLAGCVSASTKSMKSLSVKKRKKVSSTKKEEDEKQECKENETT
mmetsp:Transcript_25241/g.42066  ORF Transcript_25241/g.42066 Transcript_25241/m.42066 type:complete len:122 (-) Transcript_25241:150-515(-)